MEFGLSQDQLLLDDSLRKYLATEVSLESVRKVAASDVSDNDMWRGLADMGLAGIVIPEAHGGAELGMLDAVAVAEALGYAACPGPFLSTAIMGAHLLNRAGATDPLAGMASGDYRVGVAFSDFVGARKGQVTEVNSQLSGQSLYALDADADAYLVALADGRVYMVETEHLARQSLTTIDVTRSVCELNFSQTPACLVTEDAQLVRDTIYRGRTIQAADTLGAAQYMLDQAVAYSLDRKQFNRAIGSFQAVKHMCAEMASQLEPCRSFVWYAGHAVDEMDNDAALTACHAKAHLAEVGQFVAKTSTEVHGGMGFTDLVGLHYWFKRIGFNRQLLGSPEQVRHEAALLQGLCDA
ncbi:acyl-CoA/acyl-ACP dehydrogenase [Luminiphilus sp.]|nr:acyl-CoA/acyl-ACP dehydrogenase [Luminiphilus sp.]